MAKLPLAYHITWGTYGARLHGSGKPHVDRQHNTYGAPLAPMSADREAASRALSHDPVSLSLEQRTLVRETIVNVCTRYAWVVHEIAGQSDHTHVVISADRQGRELREALKAVASRALNQRYGVRRWWAEGGSGRYIWDEAYLRAAVEYVRRQRDF